MTSLILSHNWYLASRKQKNQSKKNLSFIVSEHQCPEIWKSTPPQWKWGIWSPIPSLTPVGSFYSATTKIFCHWKLAHFVCLPFAVQADFSCWCNCSLHYSHLLSRRKSWGDFAMATSAEGVPCAWHSACLWARWGYDKLKKLNAGKTSEALRDLQSGKLLEISPENWHWKLMTKGKRDLSCKLLHPVNCVCRKEGWVAVCRKLFAPSS